MGLDLRIPLGLMFASIGALLVGYGILTRHSDMYLRSMGANVNVLWGGVMLAFGVVMFALARRAASRSSANPSQPAPEAVPRRTH